MTEHYQIPFFARYTLEVAAADALLTSNIARTGTFTQTLTPSDIGGVSRGVLNFVMVRLDSANNRAFDFIISEAAQANDESSQAYFIFDSAQFPGMGVEGASIVDATLETFECNVPFSLYKPNEFFFTLYSAAGAFGNTLGRIVLRGVAYY